MSDAYSATEKKLAKRFKKLAYEERQIIVKHHLALKMVRAHAPERNGESGEVFLCKVLEAEYGVTAKTKAG